MNVWIPNGRSVYYAKFNHKRKVYFRSLKTANKRIALQRSRLLREAVIGEDFESLARMRQKSEYVRVVAVAKAYLEYPALQCSVRNARANASSLLSIVRRVYPGLRMEEVSSRVINSDLVYSYYEAVLADSPKGNPVARQSAENTGASNLRRARSMFSKQVLRRAYSGMKLPDMRGFREDMPFKVRVARSEDIGEDMRRSLFEGARAKTAQGESALPVAG